MKKITCLLGFGIFMVSAIAIADASRCYAIKDNDLKNNCLATVNRDKSRCYAIKERDLKNSCLAQVGNDKSRCYSIRNNDQKQQCLADF